MILLALTLLDGRTVHVSLSAITAIEDPVQRPGFDFETCGPSTRVHLVGGVLDVQEPPAVINEKVHRSATRMQLAGLAVGGRA